MEFYYSVVKSGEQFSLRNVFHRQGDFVTAEVYEISAHAIAKWDLPLDLTQPLDRTKADSEHRRWVVHCGGHLLGHSVLGAAADTVRGEIPYMRHADRGCLHRCRQPAPHLYPVRHGQAVVVVKTLNGNIAPLLN